MKMFTCPCSWRMPAHLAKAIEAHTKECAMTPRKEEALDIDQVLKDAARGKKPARPLNAFERVQLLHRTMTMDPKEFAELMFFGPIREELEKEP